MKENYEWRVSRMRQAMAKAELDGLLAFAPGWRRENVRYITGATLYSSFSLAYLPAAGAPAAFAFSVQDQQAIRDYGWVKDVRPLAFPQCSELIARLKEGGAPKKLGVAHLEYVPRAILEEVRKALPDTKIVSATKMMNQVRLVKSDWELEQIRRACTVCSEGWNAFVEAAKPGAVDFEIIAAVEAKVKSLGAQDNFMLIASGGVEVMGMTPPCNRRLEVGDMVRTELTPQLDGYYAQLCRTVVVGEPSENQKCSFEIFKESLEAGIAATKAGVTAHDIALAENDVFRKYDLGQYCTSQYTRVRGHGHGLHPDEVPSLLEGDQTVLEENAVIIIHPNTYTPIAGYHVLGDPVVVTKDGCELLTKTARILFSSPVNHAVRGGAK